MNMQFIQKQNKEETNNNSKIYKQLVLNKKQTV